MGDVMGWTIPASGAAAYQAWASSNTFEVGDILVFNFNNGAQDVAEVTETAFGACDGANPLSISTVPPARIALTTAGQHFFICTVPGHCSSGQKVAINVTTASPSATPPPPSSSAAPLLKAATPSPSASTPTSSATTPTPSPSASTSSSSTVSPRSGTVTPTPSTVSLPPKAATPFSATPLPSSTAAPPSSVLAPSAVAASPAGDAVPPAPGNSAASLSITGVSAVILTAAVALFTFP
ncbi:hypothetical protein ACJRO7_014297 [Eucalyptus globulus]|uniref:Phytocyanin domain-containing protein n=1 Tax=Eucalyptus globulus TaxID=34317 RepID=A0ABD3KZN8_EUCGL